MRACAIIAEFNPFHNGHAYLLKKARMLAKADVVVVVMSGNFVQRGEPALINKWERTQSAIQNGADLVVEIPTEYAVDSAKEFAHAGVHIAQKLKADTLVFGSENPDLDFKKESQILDRIFTETIDYHQNYASQLFSGTDVSKSNDILGVNYTYWNAKSSNPMQLIAVQRKHSNHLDDDINAPIASASAIRNDLLKQQQNYQIAVPKSTLKNLKTNQLVSWNDFWKLLKYQILVSTPAELQTTKGVVEGFEYRILEYISRSSSFDDLMKHLKTKRYTYTNIQRQMLNILLNLKKSEFQLDKTRLLAANSKGRQFIREKDLKGFLMTKVSKTDFETNYQITKRADDIYQLVSPYKWGKAPILMDNVKE